MNETNPPEQRSDSTPKTIGIGTWSLAMGILSVLLVVPSLLSPYLLSASGLVFLFFLISIFAAITGIICGLVALCRAGRMGIAGLAISFIGIALVILAGRIAFDDDNRPRVAAKASICINNLRQIDSAKQQWANENKKLASDVPTEKDLEPVLNFLQELSVLCIYIPALSLG